MIAGLGHILLTVGLVLLFVALGKRIPAKSASAGDPASDRTARRGIAAALMHREHGAEGDHPGDLA
ncbi:hypothetical protein [Nonomuraea sp. CA-141351]|uniref:hypothetical protein n=1 Tax=Nonomuraea sp. CA-141351 TaxID=3239996 RepID=UPI003D8B349D